MSEPQNIEPSKRRRSIALLTRAPLSQSPYSKSPYSSAASPFSPSPPPAGRGGGPNSVSNSYNANAPFMRGGTDIETESVAMEISTSSKSSSNINIGPLSNESLVIHVPVEQQQEQEEVNFKSGLDDPILIKKISKHLPHDGGDSLSQEGGDITRDLYKISQASQPQLKRSKSFTGSPSLSSRRSSASSFNVPGGFRREFLLQQSVNEDIIRTRTPNFLTRNFIEFLSIYGHFAGEDLEDEENIANHYKYLLPGGEEEPLLDQTNFNPRGTATDKKAYLLLLKAFVGTGVLFLPKAFSNGGLLFSILTLIFFALLSFWCYLILVYTKIATKLSSFGEIGLKLYGNWLQRLILSSIIISQIGFVAAYIVFTSQNLRAFVSNIIPSVNLEDLNMVWFILFQLVIIIPLALIRDITKLSLSATLANFFIFSGLLTILYFVIYELLINRTTGSNIEYIFNQSEFSLFIGTAIFAFEGIGLIIPIQESMIHPNNFPKVLAQVIATIALIFIIIGTLGYMTFGDQIQTVILLNLPQDSPMIILTQLLYSFAILLSTPLQLFPAIRLVESKLFFTSGKKSPGIKWLKNLFRTLFVTLTAYIALIGGQNLDKFVSFVGCFACIPLVYMYPPILHLKSCCKIHNGLSEKEKRKRYWLGILDYILVFIGGVSMVYTTYQILA
ncbi:Vacuolar amino acid transporter 4 [Spathaspora sp. JA1]|nr:Vacuolar amino acid transporter 4 [Spathaspora sp. JA1]